MKGQGGRALMETVVELVVALLIVPPLVCCAVQAIAMIIGAALPWVMLFLVVLGVAGCLGAGFAARRRILPPIALDDLAARVPPVRRPPGIPDRRRERRDR